MNWIFIYYLNKIRSTGSGAWSPNSQRWDSGSIPRLVHMRFVVDKVALGQVLHTVLRFSPVSVVQQCPIHVFIYELLLSKGKTGLAWEPSKKQCY